MGQGKRTQMAYQRSGTVPILAEALRSENGTVPFTPAGGMSLNWGYLFCPLAQSLSGRPWTSGTLPKNTRIASMNDQMPQPPRVNSMISPSPVYPR